MIRVPACARVSRVSRVCPGSPRCLFTGIPPVSFTGTYRTVNGECMMLNLPRPKRRLAKACGSNSRVVDSGMALALAAAIFALQASVE